MSGREGTSHGRERPNLLAVSYHFPPALEPRAIQAGRLLKHLQARSVVICGSDPVQRQDSEAQPTVEDALEHLVRVPFPSGRIITAIECHTLHHARPLLFHWVDRFTRWCRPAIRETQRYLDDSGFRPQVLASFAQPWSSHVLALKLHKANPMPWMVYMSDPWVVPLFKKHDPLTHWHDQRIEREIFERASYILFHSQALADEIMNPYGGRFREKVRFLPQCFEPTAYTASPPSGAQTRVIRYLGAFYGQRSPMPLFTALNRILDSCPMLLNDVRFELVGDCPERFLKSPEYKVLPSVLIDIRKMVPYRDSLNLMRSADALLQIDAPGVKYVFPAKLADYIGSGRPIMGITPPGPAATIIKELGGWVAAPDDPAQIATMLLEFLKAPRPLHPWGDPTVRARYSAENVARLLDDVIGECISKHSRTE